MSLERRRQCDIDLCDQEITNNISKNYIPAGSANIHEDSCLEHIERALADIKFDISHLTEQYQLINNKLNLDSQNRTRECHSPMLNDELSKLSFPLESIEEVESLQHILTSNGEGIKERMFNILAAIGGTSYEEMSKRMLIFVFMNEIASSYSWVGGKGKLKLHNLEIMKLMFKVRKTFPNTTEKDFGNKCKDWFRHAKHRFENQK